MAEAHFVTTGLLENLGFIVNYEKSVLVPSQRLEHLALVMNSLSKIEKIVGDKCNKIVAKCIECQKNISIRKVASLTGIMVSYTPGVENALLHYRALESRKNEEI